ncbi:multicopper oxidase-domain-containing protein [Ganoderma leucocontextum]|nr:multicopper oxidase-domain-containing protein [Ganoderma leucocontextum]
MLVTARNDTSANWVVHANMDTDMFDTVPNTLNTSMPPSVLLSSWPHRLPETTPRHNLLHHLLLVPVKAIQLPQADHTIKHEVLFDTMDDGTNHAMFGLVTYNSPLVPSILPKMSLGQNTTIASAYGSTSFVVDHFSTFDVVLKNGDTGKHPLHQFQIVGRSTDYTSSDPTLNPPLNENQPNPVRRDTVQVPGGASATHRVVADNPGAWFFHCHIEWHLEVGLVGSFIEAALVAQQCAAIPQFVYDQCRVLGQPTSGNTRTWRTSRACPQGRSPRTTAGTRDRAMFKCVATAVIGMSTVAWYALGGHISEEDMEDDAREQQEAKEKRGRLIDLIKGKSALCQLSPIYIVLLIPAPYRRGAFTHSCYQTTGLVVWGDQFAIHRQLE